MHDIVSAKHEECHCKTTGELCCKTLLKQVDRYFKLIRDKNEDLEGKRSLSQILDDTLVKLGVALKWLIDLISQGNCSEVDKQFFRDRIEALKQFYLTLGSHSTSLFYEKNEIYQRLKLKPYKSMLCLRY